jgi:hypothetical protein
MVAALVMAGSVSVLGGGLVAALSDYWPERQVVIEHCGARHVPDRRYPDRLLLPADVNCAFKARSNSPDRDCL